MRVFALTSDRLREGNFELDCSLDIEPGDVVYVTGPSGSGKTTILRELERQVPAERRLNLADIELPDDRPCIDCFDGDLMQAVGLLMRAGLGDVFNLLNRPALLSEGQRWRFRLATAMSRRPGFIFADEFTSSLGRICALALAHKIRRWASTQDVIFILAGCHRDVLGELRPDVIVERDLANHTTVTYRGRRRNRMQE